MKNTTSSSNISRSPLNGAPAAIKEPVVMAPVAEAHFFYISAICIPVINEKREKGHTRKPGVILNPAPRKGRSRYSRGTRLPNTGHRSPDRPGSEVKLAA